MLLFLRLRRVLYAASGARAQELGDQGRPPRLVRRSHAAAVVAVEILEEEQVIPKMRIPLQDLAVSENRPPSVPVAQEKA